MKTETHTYHIMLDSYDNHFMQSIWFPCVAHLAMYTISQLVHGKVQRTWSWYDIAYNLCPIYIKQHIKFKTNPSIGSQDNYNKIGMNRIIDKKWPMELQTDRQFTPIYHPFIE